MEIKKTYEYFKSIRLMLNVPQSHFAYLIGISRLELQDIENGGLITKGAACSTYIEITRLKELKDIYNFSNEQIMEFEKFLHSLKIYINTISSNSRLTFKDAIKRET